VVLVTGAAKRVGRAIALDLAAHGFDIAVHCRASRDEAEATADDARAAGARAQVFAADLADEATCRALVPQLVQAMGRLDAVVNNASHFAYDNAESFSYAAMDAHWRANTAPAVVLAQALATHLRGCSRTENMSGCVVNLSDQKLWNPNPDYLSYTLSKAALDAATTLLAQALAPQVRVVGVAPGLALGSDLIDSERLRELQSSTPLKRGVGPGEVAATVRFLLQSPSITGTTVLVDAGSHLHPSARDFAFVQRHG
jgi:NAD(P)-dependent dehydrogenase (short-subunit alcohol dehydrogenase family)